MTEKQAVWNALAIEVKYYLFLVENTQDTARIAMLARNIHRYCDQLDEIEAQEKVAA
jgi:hypothetical protein